jgi:hypothetical protein
MRYIVTGGFLNGYNVVDVRTNRIARPYAKNLGMWEAINLRDKLAIEFP